MGTSGRRILKQGWRNAEARVEGPRLSFHCQSLCPSRAYSWTDPSSLTEGKA